MTQRISPKQRWAAVLLAVMSSALSLYSVNSAWEERDRESFMTGTLKKMVVDKQGLSARHAEVVVRLAEMKARLLQLDRLLPAKFDAPSIVAALKEEARRAHIDVISVNSGKEIVQPDFYAALPVSGVVQGSTENFLMFAAGMLRDPRLKAFTKIVVEPNDDATTVRTTFTIRYFRNVEEDK